MLLRVVRPNSSQIGPFLVVYRVFPCWVKKFHLRQKAVTHHRKPSSSSILLLHPWSVIVLSFTSSSSSILPRSSQNVPRIQIPSIVKVSQLQSLSQVIVFYTQTQPSSVTLVYQQSQRFSVRSKLKAMTTIQGLHANTQTIRGLHANTQTIRGLRANTSDKNVL